MNEYSEPDIDVRETLQPVPYHEANVEAEKGETVVSNLNVDGIPELYKIGGKKHYDGGTPLSLPDQSYIFSEHMKYKDKEGLKDFGINKKSRGGTSFADISKKYKLNDYKKVLLDKDTDELAKKTAEMNIANANLKLGKLALVQESMKGFKEGVPFIAQPYLMSLGMGEENMGQPEQTPPGMAKYGGIPKAQSGWQPSWRAYAQNQFLDSLYTGRPEAMRALASEWEDKDIPNSLPSVVGQIWSWFTGDKPVGLTDEDVKGDMIDILNNRAEKLELYKKRDEQALKAKEIKDYITQQKNIISEHQKNKSTASYNKILEAQEKIDNAEKHLFSGYPSLYKLIKAKRARPIGQEELAPVGALGAPAPAIKKVTPQKAAATPTEPAAIQATPTVTPKQKALSRVLTPQERAIKDLGQETWDSFSDEEKRFYLEDLRRGGSTGLPKAQNGLYNLRYPPMPGYRTVFPEWYIGDKVKGIGPQRPGADPDKYYKTATGIIWPKSMKDQEPSMEYFKNHPAVKDKWDQYKGGYDQWLKDMEIAKGAESEASKFWRTAGSEYYPGYFNETQRGVNVPGMQWASLPILEKQDAAAAAAAAPQETKVPGDIIPGEGINAVNGYTRTPWWPQDILNAGAAFRNLAKVKPYYPWMPLASFDEAEPSFISPERSLSNINEQLAIGTQGAAQFANPQAYNARFSQMSGQAAKNAADVLSQVNNANIGTANQFAMQNTAARNEYNKYLADRQTDLYDKTTITQQNFENEKTKAFDEFRKTIGTGMTNKQMTDTFNKLYPQYAIGPGGYVNFRNQHEFTPSYTAADDKMELVMKYANMMRDANGNPDYKTAKEIVFGKNREETQEDNPNAALQALASLFGARI
jgi:hypothetical protein